ncbi:MAG: tRNA-dependent cyclodipeptide synthase [Nonomuraea sp.]|nr:tRNA-dependent cyclodipeptide synthase [Nonomuraea sp.]NUP61744.1 tRNA-dependent cyclodipeptide synthase [Nonomuraea sp.]NUP75986.1 tRNA-dependent cyclodipeptide synthase [Nonomuraea sp.]NUS08989.1 tRNA-dependent cyclodipeptide synthase [Nonomuraea sp.]
MSSVQAVPLTARCAKILAAREHAVVSVSAFNGFFTLRAIRSLLEWATGTFAGVHVLVPGVELAGTLVARGLPAGAALVKARSAANNTRNRVVRVLDGMQAVNATVFDWNELSANRAYRRSRRELERLAAKDPSFRARCLEAVRPAVGVRELSPEQAAYALPFLLAELPLLLNSPAILRTGSSVFCHPEPMPLVGELYAGALPVSRSPCQGFVSSRPVASEE